MNPATQFIIPASVQAGLAAKGYAILDSNQRFTRENNGSPSMVEVFVAKEGIKLDLVSNLWQDGDIRGYQAYVTNSEDDDCDFYNDIEALNIMGHEGALLGLIHQLP